MTLREAYSVPKHTSAICVQSFDDSLNSAIHITYRISLRSSSLREPRYPLLRVLVIFSSSEYKTPRNGFSIGFGVCVCLHGAAVHGARRLQTERSKFAERIDHSNDPSAGSPTETLLRLLLPLGGRVYRSFRRKSAETAKSRQSQRFTSTPNR